MTQGFELPEVVSLDRWLAASQRLRTKEGELRDHMAAVNRELQELPMVAFDDVDGFDGPNGTRTLLDLFDGRQQLIVYHFWFEPGEQPCEGCSQWASNLGDLSNLHDRETTLVFVSRAPIAEIVPARQARGWGCRGIP